MIQDRIDLSDKGVVEVEDIVIDGPTSYLCLQIRQTLDTFLIMHKKQSKANSILQEKH
jgi:hypothetical protein